MKHLKSKWTILVAILAAVAVLAAFSFGRNSGPQYFTAKAEQGDIHDVVEATGTINAVNTVQVGSQVSGTISKLYTDFNSRVKRGEVLAQLDPSLFAGAVLQAKADLANAQANAAAAKANPAKARCHRADRRRLRPQCRTGQGKRLEAVATNGPEVTQKFAETRRPEAFRRAAVEAGLSSFEVISNDGLGPDEPFTGVGTWLQFSKEATAWPVTELRV